MNSRIIYRVAHCLCLTAAAVVLGIAGRGTVFAQSGVPVEVYVPPLSTTDVSPDALAGEGSTQDSDPAGRIVSIVMDPRNHLVLYAASELGGVWKSVNGGGQWKESNNGLRSGISLQHRQALALDDQNPDRLLYLTQDNDGRVGRPFGGLWVTTAAGASWSHVDLPSCAPPSVLGAVFAMGQAFVATRCGVATSTDPSLRSGTWSYLDQLPFPPSQYALASLPHSRSLFACRGAQVFRSLSLGAPGSWSSATIPGGCLALAVTPDDERKAVVIHLVQVLGRMVVSLLDMDASGQKFQSIGPEIFPIGCQGSFGSGNAGVFVARRFDVPESFGPGRSYEVFAADGCLFYEYQLVGATIGRWTAIPNIHVDTWAMAITPDYSPELNQCAAYLTNDGGVYAHLAGCNLAGGWVRAMSGLHVLYSDTMAGLSQARSKCPDPQEPCPALYLPTGDNDVWVSTTGGIPGTSWRYLGTALGDAAIVLADPALPQQILASRGGGGHQYQLLRSAGGDPPTVGAAMIDIQPPNPSPGSSPPAMANIVQVMTMPSENPSEFGDYLVVSSPGGSSNDLIMRNTSGLPSTWTDISPDDQFGPGQVAAIAAAGGHSQTVIYVLTSPNATNYNVPPVRRGPGEVWKGEVVNGLVLRWVKVSMGIRTAYNIYADPYDSNYVYVSDLGDRTIKYTGDGGATWHVDRDLTDLATSYGEFVFDCGQPARADGEERTSPLAFSCPLQSVVFDRNHPNIRAVALFGSVVFSRDAGRHWIPLLVTNDGPLDNGPPEWPFSLFYESQPNPRTGHPSLFVALVGKSIKRVDGPLLDVTAGRIAICQICATGLFGPRPKLISLVLDAPRGTIPLKRDARGDFRGTLLLDAGTTPSITYHFDVDGKETPTFTHRIAAGERDDGMFHIRGDITGCFINKVSVWLRGVFARHP